MNRFIKIIKRWWRRNVQAAGVDFIYDYEIAALQGLMSELQSDAKKKLRMQLARYDRIDRSPNKRYQRFIDDDSDFRRSDWPVEILFPDEGLVHAADLVLRHQDSERARIRVKAFVVWGRFDGCEFDRSHTKNVTLHEYLIHETLPVVEDIETTWRLESIKLFTPFGAKKSSYKFVPADTENE